VNAVLRRAASFAGRWAPFVVPPAYLLLVFCLQPADHFGPPDAAPWVYSSFYDEYDPNSYALRGLNAARGRMPGAHDAPCQPPPDGLIKELDDPNLPLKPRFHLEFPPGALLLFRLGWLGQSGLDSYPAAILDGDYVQFVRHSPRNDQERRWCAQYRMVERVYMTLMVLCLLGLAAVLRAGYAPGIGGGVLLLLLPASLWFTVNRFDALPTLLVALSLACLGRVARAASCPWHMLGASAAFLAVGTAVKLFPVLLAPLVLRHLLPDWRRAAIWAGAFIAVTAACFLPPILLYGWPGVWEPLRFQLSREPMAFTAYGPLLPMSLAASDLPGRAFRLGALALTVAGLCVTRPDLAGVLRRGAVVLIVFIGLAVYFSPQWILWLAPLCLPLTRGSRVLVGLVIALDLVSYYTYPVWAGPVWAPFGSGGLEHAVYARFAVLGGLVALLLWQEWRNASQAGPAGTPMPQGRPGAAGQA
jgi:hypothetical protein